MPPSDPTGPRQAKPSPRAGRLDDLRGRIQDWIMRQMDELRPATVERARGDVLEVGFGTGLNLAHYGAGVRRLAGVDPLVGLDARVAERVSAVAFPVERHALRADGALPFGDASFDSAVITWTLCSIPRPMDALREVRRVLRPGGELLFVEHGRSRDSGTARWQDRLDPIWCRLANGCHMNRSIDGLVARAGFALVSLDRFRGRGPRVLAEMFRGVARPEC